jgi:hypothetical protein
MLVYRAHVMAALLTGHLPSRSAIRFARELTGKLRLTKGPVDFGAGGAFRAAKAASVTLFGLNGAVGEKSGAENSGSNGCCRPRGVDGVEYTEDMFARSGLVACSVVRWRATRIRRALGPSR